MVFGWAFVDSGSRDARVVGARISAGPIRCGNAQIEALARDYRVIAVDLRGFGQSEAGDEKVTMEEYADDVGRGWLDALSIEGPGRTRWFVDGRIRGLAVLAKVLVTG